MCLNPDSLFSRVSEFFVTTTFEEATITFGVEFFLNPSSFFGRVGESFFPSTFEEAITFESHSDEISISLFSFSFASSLVTREWWILGGTSCLVPFIVGSS